MTIPPHIPMQCPKEPKKAMVMIEKIFTESKICTYFIISATKAPLKSPAL
jgi:hypothetical protein